MPKIRLTITPGEEIDVPQWEADYLDSQGLVLHTRAKTDEGARRAAVRQQVPDPVGDDSPASSSTPSTAPSAQTKES